MKASGLDDDPSTFPYQPNTRLGMALTELNRKRIYRKLAAGPGFAAHEKDMLAELLDCRGAPRPSPAARRRVAAGLAVENAARMARMDPHPRRLNPRVYRMEELQFIHELSEIDDVARLAGVDTSDWSLALEPGSRAFFDGILSGMQNKRSYYLKEDLIFEMLAHLSQREPAYKRYFEAYDAFAGTGHAFGRRVDLGKALQACRRLVGRRKA
jgi:hypothetical protein